jgi:hypothetical protein
MTLETVHRRGVQVAVLLSSPLFIVVALDVAKGSVVWWPLSFLALSLVLAALGAVDAVRVYLTRGWPKVEADVIDQEERGTWTADSYVTDYSQRLLWSLTGVHWRSCWCSTSASAERLGSRAGFDRTTEPTSFLLRWGLTTCCTRRNRGAHAPLPGAGEPNLQATKS